MAKLLVKIIAKFGYDFTMRFDVLDLLVCPRCRGHPLCYKSFSNGEDSEILNGVVWCRECGSWYPIEDGLLELLTAELAYTGDRFRFYEVYTSRLSALGLNPPSCPANQSNMQAQRSQQAHFDWYADNPNQTYDVYEQIPFWRAVDELAFNEWRKEILPGAWLLDVGCAQGRSAFKIIDMNLHIVGFDISKALVRQAITRYRREKPEAKATFFVADAAQFPMVNSCFDYVLVYGVLHHLPDPGSTCQEIARVLKSGGIYFGSENNQTFFRSGFDLLQRINSLWHEEAGTYSLISKHHFQRWFQSTGLTLSVRTSIFLPPHILNHLKHNKVYKLLKVTDCLCSSIPALRNQGGLILVRGVKTA